MEAIYQKRCAQYIYVVPESLRELMSDISREVLRSQPKELCGFIADYLDSLMIIRENARIAAKFVDNITEVSSIVTELLHKTRCTLKEAIDAARIIQKCFRKYLRRKSLTQDVIPPIDPDIIICKIILKLNISYATATAAASVIQRAWLDYLRRKEFWKTQFRYIDWKTAAKNSIAIYRRLVPSYELQQAASTIKAAYKGYYIRKYMKYLASCNIIPPDRSTIIYYLQEQYNLQMSEEYEEHLHHEFEIGQENEGDKRNSQVVQLEIQEALENYTRTSRYYKKKLQSPKEKAWGTAKTPQMGVHSFWASADLNLSNKSVDSSMEEDPEDSFSWLLDEK